MPRPKRGLVVREPFAGWIAGGVKPWEVRRHPTRVRSPVGIASGGRLIGQVDRVGVEGPFGADELAAHEDRHRAGGFLEAYAQGKPLWAWVLANPVRYPEPLPVPPRRGRVVWAGLSEVAWPETES